MKLAVHNENTNPNTAWLSAAVLKVLKPIFRMIIGVIPFASFVEMSKQLYIEEARRKLLRENPKARVTKSALALMTGIDTRAINQVLAPKGPEVSEAHDLCPEAAVLDKWASDPTYRNEVTGDPADLVVYGRGHSFQSLVSGTVGRNVTPATVLERLTMKNNVELVDDNTVRLLSTHYSPIASDQQTLMDSGFNAASNLLKTVNHNMNLADDADRRFFQRQVWSFRLRESELKNFREELTNFLIEQHKKAIERIDPYETDENAERTISAGVGSYYFEIED